MINTETTQDFKVFCYLRVSSDVQDVNSQRIGIEDFCRAKGWTDIKWVMDEGISGAVEPSKRKLGGLLKEAQKGDVIVASEISRIGRKLVMILEFIKKCTEKEVSIMTVKDRYVLEDTIQSKVLVTVMGLAAEIDRDLLRQRTKEGLRRAVQRGKTLGRPKGRRSSKVKLTGKEATVQACMEAGFSKSAIARKLKVHRSTLTKFILDNDLQIDKPVTVSLLGEDTTATTLEGGDYDLEQAQD